MSRRGFLRAAGVAGLTLAAGAAAVSAAAPLAPPDKQPPDLDVPPGKKGKVGWAVMGLGELALGQILPAFGDAESAELVALVSGHRDKAEKLAAFYGLDPKNIYGYDNLASIKDNPAVGVVYNVLPNHLHAKYSIAAMEAGKDVLCEKPMTGVVEESRQMIEAAKRTGRKLMIGYRLRYEPTHWKAIHLIRDGAIGKVRVIETQNLQTVAPPNIRLSRETQGGPLGDVGVYCLQACRYLTGLEPTEVSAIEVWPQGNETFREVPENVLWQMRMPDDITAMCACGFGSTRSSRVRVVGDKGWLELDPAFPYAGLRMRVMRKGELAEIETQAVDQFAREMDYFSRCVLENKGSHTPGEEGLRDMLIMDAITRSAKEKQPVKVPELPALPGDSLQPPAPKEEKRG